MFCDNEREIIEQHIRRAYMHIVTRTGSKSFKYFEDFREKGFHHCTDPLEVQIYFADQLMIVSGIKAYIYGSNRSCYSIEDELFLKLYEKMIMDICAQIVKKKYTSLHVIIESGDNLRKILPMLNQKLSKLFPSLNIDICQNPKEPDSILSLADYLLALVSWVFGDKKPKEFQVRNLENVQAQISVIYSLEKGLILNRKV